MKPALPQRLFFVIVLFAFLLPAALAYGGLPGPTPPAPPPVPTPPPDSGFDYVKVDDARGQSGVATQVEFGTTGKDKIIEYGGLDDVTQYTEGSSGNDWLLQVGGEKTSTQTTASGGSGDDTIYQYGGQGYSYLALDGGQGNDTMVQVGGQGDNEMSMSGGEGADYIEQYGGAGNNTMIVNPGQGDDVIKIYGGPRNNTITYEVEGDNDVATILGGKGGGYNRLKITFSSLHENFILKDYQGQALLRNGTKIDSPAAAPAAALSATAGIITAGQHSVRVTFVTAGDESGSSPPSAAVLADGAHALEVSQIPVGPAGTIARKIYMTRAAAGDPSWRLAGTLSNNTSTTYSINVSDSDLGGIAPGLTTFTVANLNLITVIRVDDHKTIWQYSGGTAATASTLLLLLD